MPDHTDLIARLRTRTSDTGKYGPTHNALDLEAADALAAQQQEIERLRAALAEKRAPLTDEQRRKLWRESEFRGSGGQLDWFIEGTRAAERAHGIGDGDEQN